MLIAGAAGTITAGRLADRFGRLPVIRSSFAVTAAGLAAIVVTGLPWAFGAIALTGFALNQSFSPHRHPRPGLPAHADRHLLRGDARPGHQHRRPAHPRARRPGRRGQPPSCRHRAGRVPAAWLALAFAAASAALIGGGHAARARYPAVQVSTAPVIRPDVGVPFLRRLSGPRPGLVMKPLLAGRRLRGAVQVPGRGRAGRHVMRGEGGHAGWLR